MSANVTTLHPRRRYADDGSGHVYHAILLRDDVTISDLMHALRFSGIVLTTDRATGQAVIHRPPMPNGAA